MTADHEQQRFKAAARRFASGVTVVTTRVERRVHGITASSFASLSLDPLLVAVSVDERSRLVPMVQQAHVFAISVLASQQHDLARFFATPNREPAVERFAAAPGYLATTGAPVLAGAIAFFDCRLHSLLPAGDHRILIGEVVAAGESDGEPLLYFEGDYHALGRPHSPGSGVPPGGGDPAAVETTAAGWAAELDGADLLAVQMALEPTVAELAATAATPRQVQRLRSLLSSAAEVLEDPRRFTALSVEFHIALADASGNKQLRTVAAALSEEQQLVYETRTDAARAGHVLAEHERILSLVEQRDATAARAAMAGHVAGMQRFFTPAAAAPDQPSAADPAGAGAPDQGGDNSIWRTSRLASTSGSIARPT
jgi:flavin reductase (DIM6/NTAB) family NADH-FMN oxidoreductase RutF